MFEYLEHLENCPVCSRAHRLGLQGQQCGRGKLLFSIGTKKILQNFEPPTEQMRN